MANAEEERREKAKREKAKQLRYKKAIAKDFNLESIKDSLWDIQGECDNVKYYFECDDDETLLNALCGDEEQEWEFRMMFSDLCVECEQMWTDLEEECVPECFDTFFGAISSGEMMGWDDYEGDYFGLHSSYEEKSAKAENQKRMLRMMKQEIIEAACVCFRIAQAYMGLLRRYDCLKGALDILRDENTGFLQIVKQIEEKYEAAEKDGFYGWHESTREFNRLVESMPQIAWLQ